MSADEDLLLCLHEFAGHAHYAAWRGASSGTLRRDHDGGFTHLNDLWAVTCTERMDPGLVFAWSGAGLAAGSAAERIARWIGEGVEPRHLPAEIRRAWMSGSFWTLLGREDRRLFEKTGGVVVADLVRVELEAWAPSCGVFILAGAHQWPKLARQMAQMKGGQTLTLNLANWIPRPERLAA